MVLVFVYGLKVVRIIIFMQSTISPKIPKGILQGETKNILLCTLSIFFCTEIIEGDESGLEKTKKTLDYLLLSEIFFNNSHTAIAILDREFNFIRVNKLYAEADNRPVTDFPGHNHFEFYPGDEVKSIFENVVRTKQAYQIFSRAFVYQDNPERGITYWDWTLVPVLDDKGEVEMLIFTLVNVTERNKMEVKLRLNQQRLEALVKMNNMTDATVKQIGIFILEETIKITGSEIGWLGFVNEDETLVTNFVWSKEIMSKCEIIDKPRAYSVTTGGLWAEAILQRRAVITNDYSAENENKRGLPAGHVPLTRILNVPIFEGKRIVMQAVVANKTEDYNQSDIKQLTLLIKSFWSLIQRKIAEEKLQESERRFRNLFENSMDGIFLTKPDGTIISANPSLCQMIGMSEQEICQIGRSGIVDLSDARLYELLTERQQTGQCKGELNLLHKNGSIVPVELTSKIYKTSDGEFFASMFVRDISKQIKTQQEMARLDRLNLIGQMAAGIGHEVRNPMTIVRGFLQMLSGKSRYSDDKEYFNLMISELDRANAIITQFLSLARNTPVELQPNNLNQIIEDLSPLLQTDALNVDKNLEIEKQPTPDINVNKNEIYQLILNLVRNGLDVTQKGGCVTIKTFVDGANVVLAIKDKGNGIDPGILDKLGTPFLTTKPEGTGLGLATCFSIAKRHNARIDVDTCPEGTTFFIRFTQ